MKKILTVCILLCVILCGSSPKAIAATDAVEDKTIILEQKKVTDIDYEIDNTQLNVGENAFITAVVLPKDADNQTITYYSSDSSILTVNELGRVRAIKPGIATITLCAESVKKNIEFVVKEKEVVSEIEVNGFTDEMEVGAEQVLNVKLYPSDIEEHSILYESTNPSVATISDNGIIKGVSEGKTVISVKVGVVEKKFDLKVYIKTEQISVSESYLTLQPGEQHKLDVSIEPANATQNIIYRSTNENVAMVDETGLITAKGTGSTTIIISNENSLKSVIVIVNKGDSGSSVVNTSLYNDEAFSETQVDNFLTEELEGTSEEIVVQATPGYCVKKDFLEKILEYKKVLVIETGEITYRIDGNLVRNAEKEFIAQINMKNIPEGLQFEINKGDELPGTIEISLGNIEEKYQYLYLFNEHAGKYEKLNSYDDGVLVVNKGGTYLLAEDEIIEHKNLKNVLGISAVAVGGLFVIYVVVKKKYWFW